MVSHCGSASLQGQSTTPSRTLRLLPHPPTRQRHPSSWTPASSKEKELTVRELSGQREAESTRIRAGLWWKGRGTRDQIANIRWIMDKAREFQKNIYFCFIDYTKPLTVWITIDCGKFWKRWEYQTTWPASWEACMQVRKQQLELDMEQQTGSK